MFVSRIINKLKQVKKGQVIHLDEQFKKDLLWWDVFLERFDGISIIPMFNWNGPDKILQVDACLNGCGGWSDGEFFHKRFPQWLQKHKEVSINEKETMALIVGLKLWREKIRNKHLLVFCDNQAMVNIVNMGRASNIFAQSCLREICFITASVNAVVKVVHCRGVENKVADFLSRWDEDPKYKDLFEMETKDIKKVQLKVEAEMFKFSAHW